MYRLRISYSQKGGAAVVLFVGRWEDGALPGRKVNNPKVIFGIQPQGVFGIRNGNAFVDPVGMKLVRNGVGPLPDGRVLMAVSIDYVSFHEFADWFIQQDCRTALYLNGNVSEYYAPGHAAGGRFAVLISAE